METGRTKIRSKMQKSSKLKAQSSKFKVPFSFQLSASFYSLLLTYCFLSAPMSVNAESVMKEGYRKDYLPEGIIPRHDMDKDGNWIAIFEHERREEWQEPDKVIENMKLKKGDVIADIGAGSGYFTRRFAKAVGQTGKAFGVDIEPELIKYMKEDARRLNLNNYIPKLATMADSGLEPDSIDIVFICLTYHHIEDRINYMRKLKKVLKKDGRVIFVEFYKKQMEFGPPPSHKDSEETIIAEMKEAGYHLTRELNFLRYQYFIEFEPDAN